MRFLLFFLVFGSIQFGLGQTFLNGSFETNNYVTDQINQTNAGLTANVANTVAFGTSGNTDLITSAIYAGGPQNGSWYLGMTGGGTDLVSMGLSAPLVMGNSYTISFYDKASTFVTLPIEIGLSTINNAVGTIVHTTTGVAISGIWTQRTFTFVAPSNGQFITIRQQGTISNWVQLDNFSFGCQAPSLDLSATDTLNLCPGQSIILDATSVGATYLWQDNSTNSTLTATTQGNYIVTVTNSCGSATDSVFVSLITPIPNFNLGADTNLCTGATLLLDPGIMGANYNWQNSAQTATFLVNSPGIYYVDISNTCMTVSDTIVVTYTSALPTVNLGSDTLLCPGDAILLSSVNPGATYLWQDNSTNSDLTAMSAGIYWVEVTNGCGTVTDSIVLSTGGTIPPVNLGNDTVICQVVPFPLDVTTSNGATYLWQDNSTLPTFTVNSPGIYWVEVKFDCQTTVDSINVMLNSLTVDLGPDLTLCAGSTITLDAGNPGSSFVWSDLSNQQTLQVNSFGTYFVEVNDGNCVVSDTITVQEELVNFSFNVNDTVGCKPVDTKFLNQINSNIPIIEYAWDFGDGSSSSAPNPLHEYGSSGNYVVTLFIATVNNCIHNYTRNVSIQTDPQPIANFSYTPINPKSEDEIQFFNQSTFSNNILWNFGDDSTSANANPTKIFPAYGNFEVTLTVSNGNCSDTKRVNFSFVEETIYYVPNTFTPNGDEHNGVFEPIFTSGFRPSSYLLSIYDRWGNIIFQSHDSKVGWDGTIENRPVQDGVYVWQINYSLESNDDKKELNGQVTVLR